MGMQLPLIVVLFLVLAVLLAVGILVVVAMPHLRAPREEDEASVADHPRHTSRTGRG
jgi:ammonia channel protein AmtB